jgi:hypothetical protein
LIDVVHPTRDAREGVAVFDPGRRIVADLFDGFRRRTQQPHMHAAVDFVVDGDAARMTDRHFGDVLVLSTIYFTVDGYR